MFDGIVTKAVVSELNSVLKGAKINKISMPTKNEIIFDCYKQGQRNFLEISTVPDNCRICLTEHLKENPAKPYNFCMLLRKHLNSSRIIEISNFDLERTVEIEFETRNDEGELLKKRLYIEIMNRQSNVILTDEKGIIFDTLKRYENKSRDLFPSQKFIFTPILKTSFIELENFGDFQELIYDNGEENLSQKLPEIFIGFSKVFVLHSIKKLKIDDKQYNEADLEKLYNYIKEILVKIDTSKVSAVLSDKSFTIELEKKNEDLQINKFIDEFYYKKEQKDIITQSKNNLLRVVSASLKKVLKKLENINQKLKECENMEYYRVSGELLTANLYRVDNNKKLSEIEVYDYYKNENTVIKLDETISISKNVEKFFKKYNKLKNTLQIVSEQKKETEKEIDYIESIIFSLENAKNLVDISEIYEEVAKANIQPKKIKDKRKVKRQETKVEPIDIFGFKVYVGKNNIQNEFLTLKFASKNDLWFHAQKIHGSHVVLRTENKDDIPENVIYECAKLAKQNSKAKDAVNVPVDYCEIKFVKRAPNGKTGMVNYSNFKTLIIK